MQRPHIRFNGQTLQELDQQWSHAQNDALGYFLWFYCQLACDRQLTPQPEEIEVLLLFSRYFEAIQYWQDEDNGHWEEARKIEASSIGAVVAGLRSLQQMLRQFNLEQPTKLTSLIEAGTQALQQILPAECIQPEPQARRYDAALLFLIYPLQVVTGDMAEQIVADVVQHLKGDYGIRRYLGDSFWAPDYRTKLTPEARTADVSEDMSARDALVQIGEEAQWCIFDPIISILYGLKFQQTGQSLALELQTHYLNRALGQLTGPDCSLGAWRCPELYFKEGGCYQPNDATPLLWTQANLRLALKQMATSCA
jgi:phosphorylase kinase alpha/beta subunit